MSSKQWLVISRMNKKFNVCSKFPTLFSTLLPPSVLWHCWLRHLTRKNPSVPDMTYKVFGGTLNLTQSINQSITSGTLCYGSTHTDKQYVTIRWSFLRYVTRQWKNGITYQHVFMQSVNMQISLSCISILLQYTMWVISSCAFRHLLLHTYSAKLLVHKTRQQKNAKGTRQTNC